LEADDAAILRKHRKRLAHQARALIGTPARAWREGSSTGHASASGRGGGTSLRVGGCDFLTLMFKTRLTHFAW